MIIKYSQEDTGTLNGQPITLDQNGEYKVSDEGEYTLVVTDEAGNETKVRFIIDKIPPLITISGVEDNQRYRRVLQF